VQGRTDRRRSEWMCSIVMEAMMGSEENCVEGVGKR
jgi:hypothetical protein